MLGTVIKIHSSTLNKDFNVPTSVLDRPVSVGPGPAKIHSYKHEINNKHYDYYDNYSIPSYYEAEKEYVDVHIPSIYLSYPITFKLGFDEKGCFINEVRCSNGMRETPNGERRKTISITDGKKVYIGNEILTFRTNNLVPYENNDTELSHEEDAFKRLE